jgi:hypothetical protein
MTPLVTPIGNKKLLFRAIRKAGHQVTCLNKRLPYERLRCQEETSEKGSVFWP